MDSIGFEAARRRAERGRRVVRDLYVALRGLVPDRCGASLASAVPELAESLAAAWRGDADAPSSSAPQDPSAGGSIRRDVSQLELSVRGHGLCLDGSRIGIESTGFAASEAVREMLAQHGIGSLVFELCDGSVDLGELAIALRVLNTPATSGEPIAQRLTAAGVSAVRALTSDAPATDVERAFGFAVGSTNGGPGAATELRSIYVAKALLDQVGESRLVNPRLAKSVVRNVVDAVLGEPDLVGLLAELQAAGKALVRHGAATAVYASWIGRRIGLPDEMLVELGVAALFHDVGRTVDGADDHTEAGFRRILCVDGSRLALRAMVVARHHHDAVDDDGLADFELPSGLAPIVRVADIYDRARSGPLGANEDADAIALAAVWHAAEQRQVPRLLVTALTDVLTLSTEIPQARS